MSYHFEDDDEREDEQVEPKSVLEEYEEATKVDKDESDFLNFMFKLSKIERELAILSEDFHDGEVEGYEAKVRMMALLDIMSKVKDELYRTL